MNPRFCFISQQIFIKIKSTEAYHSVIQLSIFIEVQVCSEAYLKVYIFSWQKDTEDEVRDIIRNNLHLQGKVIALPFFFLFAFQKLSLLFQMFIMPLDLFCTC